MEPTKVLHDDHLNDKNHADDDDNFNDEDDDDENNTYYDDNKGDGDDVIGLFPNCMKSTQVLWALHLH